MNKLRTISPDVPAPQRLMRISEACQRMAVSRTTFYREVWAGRVGPIVKISTRRSAVPERSVDQWIVERIAEAEQAAKAA